MCDLTLTDFLLARIAEDEEVARSAIPDAYAPNADEDGSWVMIEVDHEGIWPEPASKPVSGWGHLAHETWAEHVERHDPARVLAECEAKRLGVERFTPVRHGYSELLAILALPYADHPDYREEWRP